jgi:DDE family transposase
LLGQFKNPGVTWRQEPIDVLDHDFPSAAVGRAIPFGIYDLARNTGFVVVGTTRETAAFAGAALRCWWDQQGRWLYQRECHWLLLADCGGANNARTWLWK